MSCIIMGVLNANEDSFYQDSRFQGSEAIKKIESMVEEGADIIDIGAVSSRPGSAEVSEDEELRRLVSIIDAIYSEKLYERVTLSLDTYSPLCARYALERGFHIINDIKGLESEALCKVISEFDAKAVLMHMQGTPETMQNNPYYENLFDEIEDFFTQRVERAKGFGIKEIVLDVGIGFGKSLQDNLQLIAELEYFKKLGHELLIGASRKSMIDNISPSKPEERLAGTLALHLKAYENGASIIRCHDVKEHVQACKVLDALKGV